jgi:hypothetical protein
MVAGNQLAETGVADSTNYVMTSARTMIWTWSEKAKHFSNWDRQEEVVE